MGMSLAEGARSSAAPRVAEEKSLEDGAPKMSPREAMAQLAALQTADEWERDSVKEILDGMAGADGRKPLWGSVPVLFRKVSVQEVRMLTRGVIKDGALDLEGDDDMEMLNVSFFSTLFSAMFFSTVAATVIPNVDMPFMRDGVLRYVMTIGIGGIPFAFLGLGLSIPGLLQALLIQCRRVVSGEYRERLVRHEASHLLVGYLLGLPVAGYSTNAVLNAVQLFEIQENMAGRLEWETVDELCAVSLAGVVGEAMKFGDGLGGFADFAQLQGFLSRATPRFKNEREEQERVRWGAVLAFTALSRHQAQLDLLVEMMSQNTPLPECLLAIEQLTPPADPVYTPPRGAARP